MKNDDILKRSVSAVWHPCSQMKHYENFPLIPIERGQGVWLYDFDGNRYLDAVSSWWVNLFGHSNPRINAALVDQLGKLEHVMLAGFTHEPVVQLSERLRILAPTGLGHCFYGSDGASATEIALKMSAHFWLNSGQSNKTNFLSLENSYHGETIGALSVTDVALFKTAYGALTRSNATVMSPDWRAAASGETAEAFALHCAAHLETHLQQHHHTIAALIVEPLVQGAAGMAMYHPLYLRRARELCDLYQIHLIADEIAVGMGRTGTLFACEQANISPDFLLISKGITGGYLPLSIVMTTDTVYQAFYADEMARGFLHSHSYTGNSLACSAALATLKIFSDDNILHSNRPKSEYLNRISTPLRTHPKVKNFRQTGMIWAFEVDTPRTDFAREFFARALKNNLLLRPMGNTVYFMPPYVITETEMQELVTGTLRTLEELI